MDKTSVVDEGELTVTEDGFGDVLHEGVIFSGIGFEKDPATGLLVTLSGYRHGKFHGPSRSWFSNGKMREEEYYRGGGHHGPFCRWFENGQLEEAGYVDRGVLVWKKRWSKGGELIEHFDVLQDPLRLKALEKARSAYPGTVIDIDPNTWEFVERPAGWRLDDRV